MKKVILFFLLGSLASFLLNYFLLGSQGWQLDIFYAVSFGLGWALAYFVDHPEWALSKKFGISFFGIFIILLVGFAIFGADQAVPSVIKFSTVFVAYYLIASFRENKSLRS